MNTTEECIEIVPTLLEGSNIPGKVSAINVTKGKGKGH